MKLVSETEAEIKVLKEYLPQQLSEEELDIIVKETISEVGATSMKDMGKIMSAIKPKTKGRADKTKRKTSGILRNMRRCGCFSFLSFSGSCHTVYT